MSDHIQSASALFPVSFQSQTLYFVEHEGEPFEPMCHVVEAMGMDWKTRYRKVHLSEGHENAIPLRDRGTGRLTVQESQ